MDDQFDCMMLLLFGSEKMSIFMNQAYMSCLQPRASLPPIRISSFGESQAAFIPPLYYIFIPSIICYIYHSSLLNLLLLFLTSSSSSDSPFSFIFQSDYSNKIQADNIQKRKMTEQPQKYPNYPPFDSQVVFYQGSSLRTNPTGYQKHAKICPKCQFPIQIRIFIKPCMHYLCYECYIYNKHECAYCSTVTCEVMQLDDNKQLYSCDTQCFKVFETADQLEKHMNDHIKIKNSIANKSS